jgi:putative transposase
LGVTRLRRIATRDRYFFITTNLAKNQPPFSSAERDILLEIISARRSDGDFSLFGYCIMPTHLHLLVRPNNRDIAEVMRELKSVSHTKLAHRRKTRGSIWQPKYFDNIIRLVRDFHAKLEYIHDNPVAAGLVPSPEQWLWSSYAARIQRNSNPIPIDVADLPADPNFRLW